MSINAPQKKVGRPKTGQIPSSSIRLSVELKEAIDSWRRDQPDLPNQSEAIRRLVELGLKASD